MLYIKSLFGNIFVLVLENFDLKGNCHGGHLWLTKHKLVSVLKNYIIMTNIFFTL